MNVRRLLRMSAAEVACRSRQEASKWMERLGIQDAQDSMLAKEIVSFDRQLRDRFESAADWFFSGAADEQISAVVNADMVRYADETIAAADLLVAGRFDLLGYRRLFFGDPIDWHLDPVSGRRAPFVHWSLIRTLDHSLVGDHKVVWELNRHQWLVTLGQAYRLTKHECYAEAFAESLEEWLRSNPAGMGVNWTSSLEVSLRLISWCWALVLFRHAKAMSSNLFLTVLKGIAAHARHVEKYLSYYFSPNTHLTGEALGLFYAGILFPFSETGKRWRDLGVQILLDESERQILPDGVHFELATCYQRYMIETYFHLMILAEKNKIALPSALGARVERMLDFLLAVRNPDGTVPEIGDADGGWLLPLSSRRPEDARGIFSTAAVLFRRSDYAWAAGHLEPETVWLLGYAGAQGFRDVFPAPPKETSLALFPHAGYAVMRNGWGSQAHQVIFDVGPMGCPISGAHAHADLLSVQCAVFGEPYLVDPGTFSYSDPAWRNFFRGTEAHSTALVDGVPQATATGPFSWRERPRSFLRQQLSTDMVDAVDAEHHAYQWFKDPITHRRRVIFVKPRYWIIVDDFTGGARHRIDLRFQFAPMTVTLDRTCARAHRTGRHGLLLQAFARAELQGSIHIGEESPVQGWVSSHYGQRQPAPLLNYSAEAVLPLRIATILFPTEDWQENPPRVSPMFDKHGELLSLVFDETQETVQFGDHELVSIFMNRGA